MKLHGGVRKAVTVAWLCVCVSEHVWGAWCVSVGEGGVVPLQLLLSAGPLLVFWLTALLVLAAL